MSNVYARKRKISSYEKFLTPNIIYTEVNIMATAKKVPYFKKEDEVMYRKIVTNVLDMIDVSTQIYRLSRISPKTLDNYDKMIEICELIMTKSKTNNKFFQILYMNKRLFDAASKNERKIQRRYMQIMDKHEFIFEQYKHYKKSLCEKRKKYVQKAQV